MSKLSSSDLVAIIRAHRADALGADDGDLATQRADALNHYHGRPYGNEVEGRSQVVSRDLAEAVDWALPGIMKVFLQSGTIAEFAPVGPEDEQLAQQESDYLNLVMMRDNPGFMVLHDAVKDTLLLKNGYVKHWWEVEEKTSEETYTGLTSEQITMMSLDLEQKGQKVEIVVSAPPTHLARSTQPCQDSSKPPRSRPQPRRPHETHFSPLPKAATCAAATPRSHWPCAWADARARP